METSGYIVEYGKCYIFPKNKMIIVSKSYERSLCKEDITNEIYGDMGKSVLEEDSTYIKAVEYALDEYFENEFDLIIGIKDKESNTYDMKLQEECINKNFLYRSYIKNGYTFKSIDCVKKYVNKCKEKNELVKFDRITLKIIITTSFGDRLAEFVQALGNASSLDGNENRKKDVFKSEIIKNSFANIKYSSIDFKSLMEELMEWESYNFQWNGYFGEIMKLCNKTGFRFEEDKEAYKLRDYIIAFIQSKNFLFIPCMKKYKKDLYLDLNNNRYIYNNESKGFHKVLSKESSFLFESSKINIKEIIFHEDLEVGYLLYYIEDKVYISLGRYDSLSKRVTVIDINDKILNEFISFINKFIELEEDKLRI